MTSASKLIKSSGNSYINVERATASNFNANDRSSTSNSNYYNQNLNSLNENSSLSIIKQVVASTEKRKKTS